MIVKSIFKNSICARTRISTKAKHIKRFPLNKPPHKNPWHTGCSRKRSDSIWRATHDGILWKTHIKFRSQKSTGYFKRCIRLERIAGVNPANPYTCTVLCLARFFSTAYTEISRTYRSWHCITAGEKKTT